MRVYIVRHGDAASPPEGGERALTEKGFRDAEAAGRLLRKEQPELIAFSPKLRTRQTTDQLLRACHGVPVEESGLLAPGADCFDAAQLIETLGDRGLARAVLVSHMPLVAELTAWLLSGDTRDFSLPGFPEASVVAIDLELVGAGQGELQWFAHPPGYEQRKH